MAVWSIILITLGLVMLALGALAKHRNPDRKTEYVLFSTMDEKQLPKRIFPFANKRDYERVHIGSRYSAKVVTIDFIQNIGITIGFIALNLGVLLFGADVFFVLLVAIPSALLGVLMWLFTDWKIDTGYTSNTIHL